METDRTVSMEIINKMKAVDKTESDSFSDFLKLHTIPIAAYTVSTYKRMIALL